jgi:hypothetical protein
MAKSFTLSENAFRRVERTVHIVMGTRKGGPGQRRWRTPEVPLGGGSGGAVNVQVVLIDKDILLVDDEPKGVTEADPADILTEGDIPLTEDQVTDEYTVVFQEPPDSDYTQNTVTELNLYRYKRVQVDLKLYENLSSVTGTARASASSTVMLAESASSVDNFYTGETITINVGTGAGQTRDITYYAGSTQVATVSPAWDSGQEPDVTSTYTINSGSTAFLDHTIIDDAENTRLIVRYKTISVWYDDGKPFLVGKYKRSDYPDYPENEAFPPDGTGTYAEQAEGFFNRKFRGIVIGGVLITALCKPLPPPELVSA